MKLNIFCINKHTQSTNRKADEQARLKSGNWLYIIDRSLYLATGATYSSLLPPPSCSSSPRETLLCPITHICISTSGGQLLACYFNFEAIVYHSICMRRRSIDLPIVLHFFLSAQSAANCLHFSADNVSLLAPSQNHLHFLLFFFLDLLANCNGQSGEINLIRTRT